VEDKAGSWLLREIKGFLGLNEGINIIRKTYLSGTATASGQKDIQGTGSLLLGDDA
jgi:hypothetical protein